MLEHVKLIHGVLAADKKDLAEALKCVDDGEDQGEKHGLPHLRRGDVAELLKRRSAVEIGGFVLLRWDGDEPCEQQNNAVPRVFPEVHEDHDPEGVFAVQPLDDGQVSRGKQAVYGAFFAEKQIDEQNGSGDGHDVRKQKDRF